jgi:arylsulfatase A-like enzyme
MPRTVFPALVLAGAVVTAGAAGAQQAAAPQNRPNIVYFLVDNLGFGELGSYGGGMLRGAETTELDRLAEEGLQLMNFAPETQCTPTRSALMTGRYAIRSGNQSVPLGGNTGGLVAWERTLAELLSDEGYATGIVGKWHIGASEGRWPTDQGFDEWIGVPHSYDEALWADDPWYDENRDPVANVLESGRGEQPTVIERLTVDVKINLDRRYLDRSKNFIDRSVAEEKPFFLYFNHTLMHLPTTPRPEFKGVTGRGDWADSLAQLDADFAKLMAFLDERGLRENTIVVFSGDNGPEEVQPWRGQPGFWDGSYFTGMEGSLRTPAMIRYPGVVPEGRKSNEIVHITDMFTTLALWAGAEVPDDRVIDGVDQRAFFQGDTETSAREGFPFWMGSRMYGVKWQNFKVVTVLQRTLTEPALELATPHIINLDTDPKEREPFNYPYLHTWVLAHAAKIMADFHASTREEELIPVGAPLDFVPSSAGQE